jgi:hypothetical protein
VEIKGKSRTIPGTESADCPVAAITAESMTYLEMVKASRTVREAGACLYGPDLGRWPAVYFDAVAVIETQIAAEQTIRFELTDASNR